jgi:pre-mRNA-processing factor 19
VTGVSLEVQDLVTLKVAKASAPKPLAANNIPGILQLLQSEWDALMLEVFNLRQNLDSTRKELAHALYQHDAACHVIARLIKEKGELQRKVEENEIRVNDLIDRL